jgi:hypothetical protein
MRMIGAFMFGVLVALALPVVAQNQTQPNAVNGCIYNSTLPTLSNLQRGVFQCDNRARMMVSGIGDPTDAAWNGTDPSASMISILKAIYLKP